jgi:hypothetical protein
MVPLVSNPDRLSISSHQARVEHGLSKKELGPLKMVVQETFYSESLVKKRKN